MTIRVIIVGLGQVGTFYDLSPENSNYINSHAKAFSRHPGFDLCGGVDSNLENRNIFTSKYGIKSYSNINQALEEIKPKIVVISTPTITHYEIIQKVVGKSYIEIILCEKPLSNKLSEAKEINQLCENNGISLYVNYNRRSDPGVINIRDRINKELMRPPIKGVCWYSKGLLNNGSHFINLLEFWLGDYVSNKKLNTGRSFPKNDFEPDFEIKFKKGKVVFQALWEEYFSHNSVELFCKNGRLRYEDSGLKIIWNKVIQDKVFNGYKKINDVEELIPNDMLNSTYRVADMLHQTMLNKETTICNGIDALKTLETIEKIQH